MIIYKTTNKINNKSYIGKDKYNNPDYLGSGIILKNAIKKYGKENFLKEILEETNDLEKESYWIKKLSTLYPLGYNIAPGGLGGDTFTNKPSYLKNKTRRKISQKTKQFIKKGIGITSKSIKGKHITEAYPLIKEKWQSNFTKAMKRYKERRQKGILTEAEKKGYQKLKKLWNSKEEKKKRSFRQLGIKNSNYNGPYYLLDQNKKIIFKTQLVKELGSKIDVSLNCISEKLKTKEPFFRGKWKGCFICNSI